MYLVGQSPLIDGLWINDQPPPYLFTGRAQELFRGVGTFVSSIPKRHIFFQGVLAVDKECAVKGKLEDFLLFVAISIWYTMSMKKETHPEVHPVLFRDTGAGVDFAGLSTATSEEKEVIDGVEHFVIPIEISSASHPFYTGEENIIDAAGRVEKFKARAEKKSAAGKQQREARLVKERKVKNILANGQNQPSPAPKKAPAKKEGEHQQ